MGMHAINHPEEITRLPDKDVFNVPGDASLDLRRLAVGMNVEGERRLWIAGNLPPLTGESPDEGYESRLKKRFRAMLDRIKGVAIHFVLNERLWPQFPCCVFVELCQGI